MPDRKPITSGRQLGEGGILVAVAAFAVELVRWLAPDVPEQVMTTGSAAFVALGMWAMSRLRDAGRGGKVTGV